MSLHSRKVCLKICCVAGELKSSEIARTAAKLAELLISHSQFVPMMLSNPGDCPPPLPKLAANLQQPLSSILPLVELDPVDTGMVGLSVLNILRLTLAIHSFCIMLMPCKQGQKLRI